MFLKRLTPQLRNASGANPQGRPRVTAGAVTRDLRLHKAAGMAAGAPSSLLQDESPQGRPEAAAGAVTSLSLAQVPALTAALGSVATAGAAWRGRGGGDKLLLAQVKPLAAALGRVVTAWAVTLLRGGGMAPETCLRRFSSTPKYC